ncbi:isoprenylcysteine carboxylmethyltransferase family protein [Burkholderia sp. FERM BP-3421]|uniref:methyltransferase family protein n=1 Tax=Burkholderia sp. FERM BP-3421 TaxID=1494466 RepID=UPI00236243C3|nr:isoprenylcysteine carboxylmethyltransferase family protein [Burkholderia sp. FERM BP-3421]WDD91260.1 isoprenylcysteine carboxylmethyltransferase family protein [Burkholderia sp. FERM BP-3421]
MKLNPQLTPAILVSTAVYLGLAIVARGGGRAFFAEPALTTVALATVALAIVSLFSQANLNPGEREARTNRWVLPVFGALGLLSCVVPAYSDRVNVWTLEGGAVRWIGVALFVVGGALRLAPVFLLGKRFSGLVAIQPGHTLVTGGLYRVIRNPSYLGLLINGLGWSLAFRSLAGIVLTALLLPPLVARMHAEEKLLHDQFGDEYDAYRARTWRLIPGVY